MILTDKSYLRLLNPMLLGLASAVCFGQNPEITGMLRDNPGAFYIQEDTRNEYVAVGGNGGILRWAANGNNEQQWNMFGVNTPRGFRYRFQTRQNGEYLGIGLSGSAVRWSHSDDGSQWYEIQSAGNGWFYIREGTRNEYLSVGGNGGLVRWEYTGQPGQKFRFLPVSAGQPKAPLNPGPLASNASTHYEQVKEQPGQRLRATDIGVGADGSVWVIGSNGGSVHRFDRISGQFEQTPGGAAGVRIAVQPDGIPWVVNSSGQIFRKQNNGTAGGWDLMPGIAKDIGIGADGSVWAIGSDFGIYKYTGGPQWAKITGEAVRIAVDCNGDPWVVNNTNALFHYHTKTSAWAPSSNR